MRYIPELKPQEIEQNHKHFSERVCLYNNKGLDFLESREFILEKASPLQSNTLEIGSGTGYTTLSLAKAGYKFTSIDKDQESLKIAALNLAYENLLSRVRFYVMDGKALTFASNSFQNIIIVNLFHHINGVNGILSEADRVLRPNGRLILADFNQRGMEIVNFIHKDEGREHENFGVSEDYIRSYFHRLGYEIKTYEERFHWILIGEKIIQP